MTNRLQVTDIGVYLLYRILVDPEEFQRSCTPEGYIPAGEHIIDKPENIDFMRESILDKLSEMEIEEAKLSQMKKRGEL